MSCLSKKHQELIDGKGSCSVPMWMGGFPAGFCDSDAYGEQTTNYLNSFPKWNKWRQPSYASGLACPSHGGPSKPKPRGVE